MKIMKLLTADNRCPELAEALAQGRVKLVRNVFNRKRRDIQQWVGIDPRNSDDLRGFDSLRFGVWQGRQKREGRGKDVFHDCDFVVSFLGENPGWLARFVGVYKNVNIRNGSPQKFEDAVLRGGLPAALDRVTHRDLRRNAWLYDLQKVDDLFSRWEKEVVVDWANPGKGGGRYGYQCARQNPKEVITGYR